MWLPEIGLYYYRARMYNPGLGRFMQTDPIGYGAGMNLYAYVRNDPVNFTDPLGLCDADGNPRYAGENCAPIDVVGNRWLNDAALRTSNPGTGSGGPRFFDGGGNGGGGGGGSYPGIGHNNPPEPIEPEIVVTARRNILIRAVRGGFWLVTRVGSVIVSEVFFPTAAGESPEQMAEFRRIQAEIMRNRTRETTLDHGEEIRRLRQAQTAREIQDRAQSRGRILQRILDIFSSIFPGG